ncbi:mannose-6-phosphate isomerase, type 1 [Ignavigranum ruoffiae]|uniref:Mannose-6-phosphate isomerase n=1 Tax=Ignavigranum ruoffiae TaxID=89093 RepID=A0A1H9F4N0_9LACT|nr:mannose-6-phosphate isomerase, class I [Ignavigranum ruoffiae]SEQ32916.1 mannose-6-phosphate isomerase, type 1 [Ignavigranum ruoffiae]
MDIIFLKAYLREKIWGGQQLAEVFNLDLPSDHVGEAWVISGHPHGVSTITNGSVAGMGLDQFYHQQPEFFGGQVEAVFPLLIKILDAHQDLSVQVHPDDNYARQMEGPHELGKTECWYIIAAEPEAELILGHHAQSAEEFKAMVEAGQWDQLLRRIPVKAGDFFYVPHGTIHAIGKGTLILETQQSSDTTYRVYDYDRKDQDGQLRELHLDSAIDVTQFPHQDWPLNIKKENLPGGQIIQYLANEYFSVTKWRVEGSLTIPVAGNYQLITVIQGQGEISVAGQTYPLRAGMAFALAYDVPEVTLQGQMELIVSTPGKKAQS